MKTKHLSRRRFLQRSLTAAGALALGSSGLMPALYGAAAKRTAVDQMTLGDTGMKLSRLGMGTGSNNGHVQTALGREGFNSLVKYAYDQGITYFDCAQTYGTFEWMGGAIKGLPREKLFIQSKIPGQPEDVLAAIDHHRKVFDTDYVDSMLIHCMVKDDWTEQWKRIMDGFDQAKEKGWIRSKGVSCHSLPALRGAADTPWAEVHLVRVNPQGRRMDGPEQETAGTTRLHEVAPGGGGNQSHARQRPWHHRHENHRQRRVRQRRGPRKVHPLCHVAVRNWTPWSSASRAGPRSTKRFSG